MIIKFTTINVDDKKVNFEMTVEEFRRNWWSDDCSLPSLDDPLLESWINGVRQPWFSGMIFQDFIDILENRGVVVDTDIDTPLTKEEITAYLESQGIDDFDWLSNHPRPHQAREAVRKNINLLDFDEWMSLENILTRDRFSEEIPYKTALKINKILWEDLDMSPMDMDNDNPNY